MTIIPGKLETNKNEKKKKTEIKNHVEIIMHHHLSTISILNHCFLIRCIQCFWLPVTKNKNEEQEEIREEAFCKQ